MGCYELERGFKAAVLTELGQPLKIIEGVRATELRRGQIFVKVFYAGVCHSQVMEARGHRGEDPYIPHMMGHEGTGEVVAVGEGVTKVMVGDHVVLGWIKGIGIDSGGATFKGPDGEEINAGGVTTFSEYTVVSENRVVKLPGFATLKTAVLYGCAIPTGAGIVINEICPEDGSTIVIIGLGGIGISALLAAGTTNPAKLIAVDIEEKKLELARELGATHLLSAKSPTLLEELLEIVSGGVDYAIEASGQISMIETAFDMIRRGGGEVVFASHPAAGSKISIDPFELICGKKIRGSWGGGSKPDRDIPKLDALHGKGRLPLEPLLDRMYSLSEINKALDDLEDRKVVRALVEIHAPD